MTTIRQLRSIDTAPVDDALDELQAGIAEQFESSVAEETVTAGAPAPDLVDLMEQAEETIPNRLGRPVLYMNRTVRRMLRRQVRSDVSAGGGLTFENFAGKRVLMFGETPIRTVDALVNNEALVL